MKKILSLVIIIGFVIMLGTAGSVDVAGMSVIKAVLLEVLGMIIVLFGTSALMHYNRYSRKMLLKKRAKHRVICRQNSVSAKIRMPEKELC